MNNQTEVVHISKKKIVERVSNMLDADLHPGHEVAKALLVIARYINSQPNLHEEVDRPDWVNTIIFKLYYMFTGQNPL